MMTGIFRRNLSPKTYNGSSVSSVSFIQSEQSPISYPRTAYGRAYGCVKQEKNSGNCLQTVLKSANKKLSEKHVRLDRWIIKPYGDGICVEGHRRFT